MNQVISLNKLVCFLLITMMMPGYCYAHGFSVTDIIFILVSVTWPFVLSALLIIVIGYRIHKKQSLKLPLVVAVLFLCLGGLLWYIDAHQYDRYKCWVDDSPKKPKIIYGSAKTSDEQLKQLIGQPNLIELNLCRSSVEGPGLLYLKDITTLRKLILQSSSITDEGAQYLIELKQLNVLSLRYTQISNTSIVHLSKLTHLDRLDIRDTKIDEAGIKQLKANLPDCTFIKFDY